MSDATKQSEYVNDVTAAQFQSAVLDRSREIPVLADFWATWCAPCRALAPILERLAADYAGGFMLAKIDTEQEQQLAAEFQIRSIPSVKLFKDGKLVSGFQGALPEEQIRRFLTQHGVEAGGASAIEFSSDPTERVSQLRAAVDATPARGLLRLELALAVLAVGDLEVASRLLEALPSAVYSDARAVRARARIALLGRLAVSPPDSRHALAVRAIVDGNLHDGFEELLDLLRDEKDDDDGPARAALVDALQMIEDGALVRNWRQRMARVLF